MTERPTRSTIERMGYQRSWQSVVDEVAKRYQQNEDFTLSAGKLVMERENGHLVADMRDLYRPGAVPGFADQPFRRLELNDWASGQLFERLGIPTVYARKLPPRVLAENVNWGLEQDAERSFLIRTTSGNTARAILSDRFTPYDHMPAIEALETCLRGSDVVVRDFHIDDMGFHLKMTTPTLRWDVGDFRPAGFEMPHQGLSKDVYESGLYMTNSEVGARAFRIAVYVLRLVCWNGLIGPGYSDLFYQRHTGLTKAQFEVGVQEAVGRSLKASEETIGKLIESRRRQIESPVDIIESIAKANRLSDKFSGLVMTSYGTEQALSGDTEYTLGQALTRAAQQMEDPNGKVEIEELAGKLLFDGLPAVLKKAAD